MSYENQGTGDLEPGSFTIRSEWKRDPNGRAYFQGGPVIESDWPARHVFGNGAVDHLRRAVASFPDGTLIRVTFEAIPE